MAKGPEIKLYAAAGVLVVLGGAFYLQQQDQKKDTLAHTAAGAETDLPKIEFSEEAKGKVTKLVIEKPAKEGDKPEPAAVHVLGKEGETWRLLEPVSALANQNNVDSALTNLTKVSVKERVASGASAYEMYDLSDDKAMHVQAFEGDKVVFELWTGKSGGRGQMARIAGQDGVFSLDGFSSYSFARDTKGWRDLKIVEIDADAATEISIQSEKGDYSFVKSAVALAKKDEPAAEGDKAGADKDDADKAAWSGKFKKAKAGALVPIKDFDGGKVLDLLRAYKVLNATAFGDGKTLTETGLEKPASILTIKSAGAETRLLFGSTSEGNARWVKVDGRDTIYAVGSWAADWAFPDESKFQKKADAKKGAGEEPEVE
jgi:hypothetical protein